ncbi:MAG: choice-of-anchor V domain-containing protein [Myxococcales bacterium]
MWPFTLLWCALSLLFVLSASRPARAHASGMATGGCGGCHTGGKPATVTITADPMALNPGQMTTLTIAVSQTNGTSAGFYLDSSNVGTFNIVDAGTKLMGLGVTQTKSRIGSGGTTTFQVGWTAPSTPGGVAFSVWANSADGDGRSSGDGEGIGAFSIPFGCTGTKYFRDADGDGVGAESSGYLVSCSWPQNYAAQGDDCNDNDQDVYPGAAEICDGKDNDCDRQIDQNLQPSAFCTDTDGDGHGVSGQPTVTGCKPPFGYGLCDNDCNDKDPTIYPGAMEACNNRDDNCNGRVDEDARAACGIGWCARYAQGCDAEACIPGQPRAEECNAFDDDCDGVADNGSNLQLCGRAGFACSKGACIADANAAASPGVSGSGNTSSNGTPAVEVPRAGNSSGSCAVALPPARPAAHSPWLAVIVLGICRRRRRFRSRIQRTVGKQTLVGLFRLGGC